MKPRRKGPGCMLMAIWYLDFPSLFAHFSLFPRRRRSELKHSRVAMLASTGFLIQAAGIHFPGMISEDLSFASLAEMKPVEQWLNVPEIGENRQL
jgi:hypothetical protein